MEVEEYIHQKVKIFKNKTYFHLFQTILINLSKNVRIYRKKYSLSGNLENNLNKNKNEKSSVWFYIMKIVLDKLKEKEKAFFPKNNLDVNPLVFSYLVKLCKNKMAKLEKLSIIENAPMDNLIRLYLVHLKKDLYQIRNNLYLKHPRNALPLHLLLFQDQYYYLCQLNKSYHYLF